MGLLSTIGTIGGFVLGGPAGAALGGSIGGGIDSYNQQQDAEAAADQYSAAQNAALEEQARLYGLQADMGEYFFDQYQDQYAPLAQSQLQAAQAGVDPAYMAARADSNVVNQYGQALEMSERNLARNGVSPMDGRFLQMQSDAGLGLASARVGAQNIARQQVEQQNYNRRNEALNFGSGLVGRGSAMVSNAAGGYGNSAVANGQQAGLAGQAAGYAANGVNNAWGDVADGFTSWWNGRGASPAGSGGGALSGFGVGLGSSGGAGGYAGLTGFGGIGGGFGG